MKCFGILIRSFIRTKYRNLIKIMLLTILSVSCMVCAISLYTSGTHTVTERMESLKFGDVTIWVGNAPERLAEDIAGVQTVRAVLEQPLIYADYQIEGKYSDNEGQLLTLHEEIPYRFIDKAGIPLPRQDIHPGEIYISPALKSSFDVGEGTDILFEYSRTEKPKEFTVRGYFEDPFMGSSMIDMKSFLISEEDFNALTNDIRHTKDADLLAKSGAMLHILGTENRTTGAILGDVMEKTDLSLYTEFAYTRESIQSYMLLLQNILCAVLGAFSLLMLIMAEGSAMRNLSDTVAEDADDIASLRMLGASGKTIRYSFLLAFLGASLVGIVLAVPLGAILAKLLAVALVSSTGLKVSVHPPAGIILAICLGLLLLQTLFLLLRTKRILHIRPVRIKKDPELENYGKLPGIKRPLALTVSIREVLTGKRKYIGLFVIAVLLTVFLSVVGRMTAWLGPNGEGLMNAFSVADHDLGVQPFNSTVPMDEIRRAISWYSPIREEYEIAMQPVYVNGREYTANVLNDESWFHVLKGKVCSGDEILITDTVANELDIHIGDQVRITGVGRTESYTVSGIYMCANGMGSNIGMTLAGYSKIGDIYRFIWCHHYILENGAVRDYVADFLRSHYRGIDVHTNSWSGLDGIVGLMHLLIAVIYLVSGLFIGLIVSLISKSIIRSETETLTMYKVLGMSRRDIRLSFAMRFMIVVTAGSLIGILFSWLFADRLIGSIFVLVGIGEFYVRAPVLAVVIPFASVPLGFFLFAYMAGRNTERISVIQTIQE